MYQHFSRCLSGSSSFSCTNGPGVGQWPCGAYHCIYVEVVDGGVFLRTAGKFESACEELNGIISICVWTHTENRAYK